MTPTRLFLASSNPGKLSEYRQIADNSAIALELFPAFDRLPPFDETSPTFAENSAGKALHYSEYTSELVVADDSGLVVPALGGEPGVYSARYAGPGASDAERIRKLLREMQRKTGNDRRARFICVVAVALQGRPLIIASDFVEGKVTNEPHGQYGFGYDPVFFSPQLGQTFAESSQDQKNRFSHRGKAFRKVLELLSSMTNSATPS